MFIRSFVFLILLFNFSLSAQKHFIDEPNVRVQIIDNADSLLISFNENWFNKGGNPAHLFSAKDSLLIIKTSGQRISLYKQKKEIFTVVDSLILISNQGTLKIKDVPYGIGWWWAGEEERSYEGEIAIYCSDKNKLQVVVKLALENYLKGVVPYEIGGDAPVEALKAQAVAARSEAIIALESELYNGPHHDLTSDVECQVFSGNHKRTLASDSAVKMTAGLILSEDGMPINAYYASNCGGHSEIITNVWPQRPTPATYLVALADKENRLLLNLSDEKKVREWIFSEPDVFCNPKLVTELPTWSRKNFRWQKKQDVSSLSKMLNAGRKLGNLHEIKALKRGLSGRIYSARFVFEQDSFTVNGELNIRQLWQPALRSACFVVDKTDSTFILNGAGWGHGVGMCQSGAVSQAKQGKDYKSILRHYYPKAKLSSYLQ